jgi:glycine hydroxymethyltransferase
MAFDWRKFSDIAEKVGAWLIADISHVVGLVIAGVYPSPVKHAHVIMSTTHKTLRGPRGAIIWVTDKGIKKDGKLTTRIDRAVFPGMQGGPHNNQSAGIAIVLEKASKTSFKVYGKQVVKNAKVLADELKKGGLNLVANGTECHLILVDLRENKLSGNVVAEALEVAGIVANRNSVPNDTMPPFYPSGLRLGTPAITTRGMKRREMSLIVSWILQVVSHIDGYKLPSNPASRVVFMKAFKEKIEKDELLLDIAQKVKVLCKKFPVP